MVALPRRTKQNPDSVSVPGHCHQYWDEPLCSIDNHVFRNRAPCAVPRQVFQRLLQSAISGRACTTAVQQLQDTRDNKLHSLSQILARAHCNGPRFVLIQKGVRLDGSTHRMSAERTADVSHAIPRNMHSFCGGVTNDVPAGKETILGMEISVGHESPT